MKKSRSLDLDGLDGVLPSASKAHPESRQVREQSPKTLKKPKRGFVPWLVGTLGLLALLAVLAPSLRKTVESTHQSADLGSKITPAAAPTTENLALSDGADTRAQPAQTMATETQPGEANARVTSEQAGVANQPQPSEVIANLPTEPTAAGIQQVPANPVSGASANAAPGWPVVATVYFKFDSSKPIARSAHEFDDLFNTAKRCQEIKLTGHTCNLGMAAMNQQLGLARADALKKLLVSRGYAAERVITASAGMDSPVAPNDTKAGQALNRRVELQCRSAVN